jgi:hypothetical protein
MINFEKKVKDLNTLFIYRFKFYDHVNKKLKLYFISPDNFHLYLSIDSVINENKNYQCEIGDLYLNEKFGTVFEDTPKEIIFLEKKDYKIFNYYFNNSATLDNIIVNEIIKSYNNLDKDLVF